MLIIRDINRQQQMDSRRQVVLMLGFVVACFFLLLFPYRLITLYLLLAGGLWPSSLVSYQTWLNLVFLSRILIYLHSAINPIAYNMISIKFRRAFMSILFCRGAAARRHFAHSDLTNHYQNNLQQPHHLAHQQWNNNGHQILRQANGTSELKKCSNNNNNNNKSLTQMNVPLTPALTTCSSASVEGQSSPTPSGRQHALSGIALATIGARAKS